jgi:hypothetical protein
LQNRFVRGRFRFLRKLPPLSFIQLAKGQPDRGKIVEKNVFSFDARNRTIDAKICPFQSPAETGNKLSTDSPPFNREGDVWSSKAITPLSAPVPAKRPVIRAAAHFEDSAAMAQFSGHLLNPPLGQPAVEGHEF